MSRGKHVKMFMGQAPMQPRQGGAGEFILHESVARGFIRSLLKRQSKLKGRKLERAEYILFHMLRSFTDEGWVKVFAGKSAEEIEHRVEEKVEKGFHLLNQKHPSVLIQVHADGVASLIKEFPFKRRSDAHYAMWIDKHVPPILIRMDKARECSDTCAHRTTPPAGKKRDAMVSTRSRGELRNHILAYYHGTSVDYIQQLLAGR